MKELMIQPSYVCNQNCVHCSYGDLIKGFRKLSLSTVDETLKKFAHLEIIKISGGEPMILKDLENYVNLCRKSCDRLVIQTNGLTIQNGLDIDELWVSLYGKSETHHKIINTPFSRGTYEKVIQNLLETEYHFILQSPIFTSTQIKEAVDIAKDFNTSIRLVRLLQHGSCHLPSNNQEQIASEMRYYYPKCIVTCSLGGEKPQCQDRIVLKPDGTFAGCTYEIRGLDCPYKVKS